ncbi:MAG: hypothetical protein M5U31_15920 [Acidimicrobiia bacterium]|nr:hypothetical protein [Acidimicrobiia bacterium]
MTGRAQHFEHFEHFGGYVGERPRPGVAQCCLAEVVEVVRVAEERLDPVAERAGADVVRDLLDDPRGKLRRGGDAREDGPAGGEGVGDRR